MNLIDSRMEDAVMLDLVSVPDGFGGVVKEWRDGAAFRAAILMKSTTDAEIAYQQGAKRLYTVYTRQIVRLERGDRFRRVSDGRVLRVTSDAVEDKIPGSSALDLYRVQAEVVEP